MSLERDVKTRTCVTPVCKPTPEPSEYILVDLAEDAPVFVDYFGEFPDAQVNDTNVDVLWVLKEFVEIMTMV